MRFQRPFICLLVLGSLFAARAHAAAGLRLDLAGELTVDESGARAELVRLPDDLIARLLAASQRDPLVIEGWPIDAGERAAVALRRFDVYAPDARILAIGAAGTSEVPRSRLVFLRGDVSGDADAALLVTVDAAHGELRALQIRGREAIELAPVAGRSRRHLLHHVALDRHDGAALTWSCAQQATDLDRLLAPTSLPAQADTAFPVGKTISLLHTAKVAVDTDNELMLNKFANNHTSATNYIANLFALMNVIYQRDLRIQLLQGTVVLRDSTTLDPYSQNCTIDVEGTTTFCTANGNQLSEFSNYWAGGCGGTCVGDVHAIAMMLSGKELPSNSASGIAWVGGLCSSSTGYSFNQVFPFAGDSSVNDVLVTAHEIGHNFGSLHTHCYNPPIDECFNTEPGCYSGPQICPSPATYDGVSNVTGTLMSYCHLSGLSGCTSSLVFHDRTRALLDDIVQSKVGQCILLPTGTFEFEDEFEQPGFPAPWATKSP